MADESSLLEKLALRCFSWGASWEVTSGSWDWRLAFSAKASSMDSRKLLSTTSKAWRHEEDRDGVRAKTTKTPGAETPVGSNKLDHVKVTM